MNKTQIEWLKANGWTTEVLSHGGIGFKQSGHQINQRQSDHSVKPVPATLKIWSEMNNETYVCCMVSDDGRTNSPYFIKSSLKNCFSLARDHYGACRKAS